MSTKDDGGPAFPQNNDYIDHPTHGRIHRVHAGDDVQPGMSLRDWFAGQALSGMLAHSTRYKPREGAPANWHQAIAEEAYELADAMLAERARVAAKVA
jgi:hypothetical protein